MKVGDKIKFAEEKQRYTVQACDFLFLVCTKPFNPAHTVLYTIVDLEENVRGTENLIFGAGAETREQCEEMLDRLNGRYPDRRGAEVFLRSMGIESRADQWDATEVSHRNRIPLVIESTVSV